MFSLDDRWYAEDLHPDGEIQLHKALFEDHPLKAKKRKRRDITIVDPKTVPISAQSVSVCDFGRKSKGNHQVIAINDDKKQTINAQSEDVESNPVTLAKHKKFKVDSPVACSSEKLAAKKKKSAFHSKMASKMEGARFRWINEKLYTTSGRKAKEMFDADPDMFEIYHKGFSTQVSKWPQNPLDRVIDYVREQPTSAIIADFGCGTARLSQSVPHTVHSFDLKAANSHVTACDMARVPLAKSSVDVCVFCLSLMGTNLSDFIKEARRVLRAGGLMKICEITSRFSSEDGFACKVEAFGFKLLRKDSFSKLFVDFEFKAISNKTGAKGGKPNIQLKPCNYKKR